MNPESSPRQDEDHEDVDMYYGQPCCGNCASIRVCPTVRTDGTHCQDHNRDYIFLAPDCWKKSPEHERFEAEQGGILRFRSGDPDIAADVMKEMVRRWYAHKQLVGAVKTIGSCLKGCSICQDYAASTLKAVGEEVPVGW